MQGLPNYTAEKHLLQGKDGRPRDRQISREGRNVDEAGARDLENLMNLPYNNEYS